MWTTSPAAEPWTVRACARLAGVIAMIACAFANAPAQAHDVPPSIVMLDIGRTAIDAELQLPLSELGSALNVPLAANPGLAIEREGLRIEQYVADGFQIRSRDGQAYTPLLQSLELKTTANPNWSSNDWIVVHARMLPPPGASTAFFTIDDRVIIQRVMSHNALVYVRRDLRNGLLGDRPVEVGMAGFGSTRLTVDGSEGSWWQGFGHMFALGLRHIAEGPDHLLFLLALLLPAPLVARAGRWSAGKGLGASARTIVGVVSGFTVGHSISLALAGLEGLGGTVRGVEALIAVSILVSCLHAWRPMFAGKELWVASAFGLVHGLAFAEMLAGLDFDGTTLGLSLLGFNLGIEAMQLAVIAAVLPSMLALSTTRAYPAVRIAGAGFAAACALGWLLERAFGLANPLQSVADWLAPPPAWFAGALCAASAWAVFVLASRWRWSQPASLPCVTGRPG